MFSCIHRLGGLFYTPASRVNLPHSTPISMSYEETRKGRGMPFFNVWVSSFLHHSCSARRTHSSEFQDVILKNEFHRECSLSSHNEHLSMLDVIILNFNILQTDLCLAQSTYPPSRSQQIFPVLTGLVSQATITDYQKQWFRITEIYIFTEARSGLEVWKSKCQQALEKNPSLLLEASRGSWCSLPYRCITPISASIFTQSSLPCLGVQISICFLL